MSKRKKTLRLRDGRLPWEPKAATLERRKGFGSKTEKDWEILEGDADEGSLAKTKIEFRGCIWDLTLFLPSIASREPGLTHSLLSKSISIDPDTSCLPFSLSQGQNEAAGMALTYPKSHSIKVAFPVPQPGFPDSDACDRWVNKSLKPLIVRMIEGLAAMN